MGALKSPVCSQGHKLSPTTTFKRANGQRECKICSMARSKAWRESRKEPAKA